MTKLEDIERAVASLAVGACGHWLPRACGEVGRHVHLVLDGPHSAYDRLLRK